MSGEQLNEISALKILSGRSQWQVDPDGLLAGTRRGRFVERQARRLHMKRAKLLTTALRSYLDYARYRGDITLDLAAAVPTVPNWSMTSIPRAICADSVHELLAGISRRTAAGRRDYAIILLLARLGLRSIEVARLELDEIDWNAGCISVRGTNGHRTALPLPADLGKAIATYLKHGRPSSGSRRVFLRNRGPIRGFVGSVAVASLVRRRLRGCCAHVRLAPIAVACWDTSWLFKWCSWPTASRRPALSAIRRGQAGPPPRRSSLTGGTNPAPLFAPRRP
jgi:integrase